VLITLDTNRRMETVLRRAVSETMRPLRARTMNGKIRGGGRARASSGY